MEREPGQQETLSEPTEQIDLESLLRGIRKIVAQRDPESPTFNPFLLLPEDAIKGFARLIGD